MKKYNLKNSIQAAIKTNNNTPRCAVVMYVKINKEEEKTGLYYILSRLFLKGTKTRTSDEISDLLDENVIDISIDKKNDYFKFKLLCLNEDIDLGLDILRDIFENSTFDDLNKEVEKIKGEFEADLDSAKIKAQDEYYRIIYKNHPYGTGRKEILNQIDSITKEDLLKAYNEIKYNLPKNICVVSSFEHKTVLNLLEKYLGGLITKKSEDTRKIPEKLDDNIISVVEKEDANQAQIFQGWRFPSVYSEEYPVILLLNTIIGASGLSSRLFLELREKQGLAYTVRSVYEPNLLSGQFFVYIATEPKNIKTSIEGFKIEINKIMTELITDEELENAKNNAIGKRQFYTETNISEASLRGYYEFLGLGFDFEEKLKSKIKSVTKQDIINTAEKYFSQPKALCVLAPKKYLESANLI